MDRKTFTLIAAAVLIVSFFLAYFSFFGVSISGYDSVTASGGNWQKYLLLLFPLSGILLLVGALNNGNYILGRGLLCWLPLLTVLYIMFIGPLIDGMPFGDLFKGIGRGYGIGLWLTIVASLALAFYNPRPKA